jgi:hypothetical protein
MWVAELTELKNAYIKWNDSYKIENIANNQPKKMKTKEPDNVPKTKSTTKKNKALNS